MSGNSKTWNFDEYDWLDRYDEVMHSIRRLCYDETLSLLPKYARAERDNLILDIGTGTGNSAVPFLKLGCRVIGIDPSLRMLEYAGEKVALWVKDFRFIMQESRSQKFLSMTENLT